MLTARNTYRHTNIPGQLALSRNIKLLEGSKHLILTVDGISLGVDHAQEFLEINRPIRVIVDRHDELLELLLRQVLSERAEARAELRAVNGTGSVCIEDREDLAEVLDLVCRQIVRHLPRAARRLRRSSSTYSAYSAASPDLPENPRIHKSTHIHKNAHTTLPSVEPLACIPCMTA